MSIFRGARLVLAAAIFAAASCGAAQAADVHRQVHTPSGSDVVLYKDGSATLINQAMRWNMTGQWKKEGGKDCVDWRGRGAQKQCY
jgi:hypothetical protein